MILHAHGQAFKGRALDKNKCSSEEAAIVDEESRCINVGWIMLGRENG